jgi:N6-adenosine-specific RNA methylase IME4
MNLDNEEFAKLPKALRIEIAENAFRSALTQSELAAQQQRILAILRRTKRQGRRTDLDGTSAKVLAEVDRATQLVGKLFGESHTQVEKRLAVVAAAEAEPEKYGKLAEAMDRRGRVNGPYRRLLNMRSAEQIRAEPPPLPNGQWRVAVADVPWPAEPDDPEPAERGYWTFATMSIEAICALPIGSRLHDHSVLWFWTTNFHMRHAYTILDAWGFRATPTIQTWGKPQPGRGQRLLGQTEHAIMAIRGNPVITLTNQSTLLLAPIPKPRTLARKPSEFYAMVESLCQAPGYLDIFSRYRHNDRWTCWGAEAPAPAPLELEAEEARHGSA